MSVRDITLRALQASPSDVGLYPVVPDPLVAAVTYPIYLGTAAKTGRFCLYNPATGTGISAVPPNPRANQVIFVNDRLAVRTGSNSWTFI